MASNAKGCTPLEQIWYSGSKNNKFLIDFTGDNPKVTCGKPVGQSTGFEGTANFTDPDSGTLRLYTDGVTAFNGQTNQILKNGNALGGNPTAGEAAMIVPVVDSNPDTFYIFTNNGSAVHYSVVDLSQGENGTVIKKKVALATYTGEALGVVPHTNKKDFWVLVFNTAARLHAYKVDDSGVTDSPVVSNTGYSGKIGRGSIVYSPDYNTLSIGWAAGRIATANIDRSTGEISAFKQLVSGQVGYASAFSPDGSKLYYTYGYQGYSGTPWQYDFNTNKMTQLSNTGGFGGPKLANNGKIYWAKYNVASLGVVNNPNEVGAAADLAVSGLSLNKCKGAYNLPNQTASSIHFIKPPVNKALIVKGTDVWLDTGIEIDAGEHVLITATGTWKNDGKPETYAVTADGFETYKNAGACIPDANFASLIGRIGSDGTPFFVGSNFDQMATNSGKLFLQMNDVEGLFGDNVGELNVTVEVK